MSSAGDLTNGQSQPLRLLFDGGTLIAEGIAANEEPDLPGMKYDNRTRHFRAEAIWYRTIVEYIRKNSCLLYGSSAGLRARRVAAAGGQSPFSAPGRGPGSLVERGRARRRRPANRNRQDPPRQYGDRSGRADPLWLSRPPST